MPLIRSAKLPTSGSVGGEGIKIFIVGRSLEWAVLIPVVAMLGLACGTATTSVPVPAEEPTALPSPTPNLEATVEARLQSTMAAIPKSVFKKILAFLGQGI